MKLTTLVLFFSYFLMGCSSKSNTEPFTTNILPNQDFLIDNAKDTVLTTVHGSKISIKANSFNAKGDVTVTIKEALTAFEIFAAGLTTESNGRPLRSGGMIFIDAKADGKQPEILLPINISIPNSSWDEEMQLFKGEETAEGNINWVEPDSLKETEQSKRLGLGKAIFESKCRTCHDIFNNSTGPAMMGVDERIPDRSKIHQWITNSVAGIKSGDPLFIRISKISPTTMDLFPALTRYDTDAIIDYVNNEVKLNKNNIPTNNPQIGDLQKTDTATGRFYNACDTHDTIIVPLKGNEISFIATSSYTRNDLPTDTIPVTVIQNDTVTDYYEFDINTLGWYNIDAFMADAENMIEVKLTAEVNGYDGKDLKVHLFCPDKKIQLTLDNKEGNIYHYDINKGELKLFENDRAILFAITKKDDVYYYGISEFRIKDKQQIIVNVQKGNFDAIKAMLTTKKIEGIDIQIEEPETKILASPCDELPMDTLKAPNVGDLQNVQ